MSTYAKRAQAAKRRTKQEKDRVFSLIRTKYNGSVKRYVMSNNDLQMDYLRFESSHNRKALIAKIKPQYNKWSPGTPKPRGRLPLDDGSPITRPRGTSVRTVSGGLPGSGRRR